jgi:para-aminobenzoate synthetase component 1
LGPFPVFSVTNFKGDMVKNWHFSQNFSPENAEELFLVDLDTDWKGAAVDLPANLEDCSRETATSFKKKVLQAQQAQRDGQCWVLNLTHALDGEWDSPEALLATFNRFLESEPPHFGGVVWTKDLKLASFSPEIFLRQRDNELQAFPIKGTGTKSFLKTSEKEIAELAMVTDLLRNDLGQIAEKVWVNGERTIFPQGSFYHAQSEIVARVAPENFSMTSYQRLLPAGSISGCPKKRVVGIIESLESFDRGFYTGTFGIRFSPTESVFNILIRTLFAHKDGWRFPVGAGITIDSDPESEWEETLQKAESLVQLAQPNLS